MTARKFGLLLLVGLLLVSGRKTVADESPLAGLEEGGIFSGVGFDPDAGPVMIKADVLEVDYLGDQLTYRGNVVVRQSDMVLKSNQLTLVYHVENADPIVKVVATGNVVIKKGETVVQGGRAVYDRVTQTIVLSEEPVLRQGPNQIGGERIKVFLAEGRSVVEGGKGRVTAVLYPNSEPAGVR